MNPKRYSRRLSWALAAVVLCGSVIGVLATSRSASEAARSSPAKRQAKAGSVDRFWRSLSNGSALEFSSPTNLKDLTAKSDVVGLGVFTSFGVGRVIAGAEPENRVVYGTAQFRMTRPLAGRPTNADKVFSVEFLMPAATAEQGMSMARSLAGALPRGPVLAFLVEKRGPQESGLYRATSFSGLWAATSRDPVDTPLTETPHGSGAFDAELGSTKDIESLADRIGSLG
jgi:hypothetical protein